MVSEYEKEEKIKTHCGGQRTADIEHQRGGAV